VALRRLDLRAQADPDRVLLPPGARGWQLALRLREDRGLALPQEARGDYSRAPVLIDRLQGIGPRCTNVYDTRLKWVTTDEGKSFRTPNHPQANGAPEGGNFLFEDGHVAWLQGRKVTLGSWAESWQCFYKVPLD